MALITGKIKNKKQQRNDTSWEIDIEGCRRGRCRIHTQICIKIECKSSRVLLIPFALYFAVLRHTIESKVGVSIKCIRQMGPCRETCRCLNRKRLYIRGCVSFPLCVFQTIAQTHTLSFSYAQDHIHTHIVSVASKISALSVNSWPSLSVKCLCSWP